MSRSRASARQAGTRFETEQAAYLTEALGYDVERRARNGAKDRGDLAGVRDRIGARVVVECKNTTRTDLPGWLREAEKERVNDSAAYGVAMFKKHGSGKPGEQYVVMDTATFARLLGGVLPSDPPPDPHPDTPLDLGL